MQLKIGEIVEGKVSGITKFGAFVDLGENTSGMVHISEVARTYVNDINEHVKLNDTVKVKVLNIGEDGKISLSIKRALDPEPRTERPRRESRRAPRTDFSKPSDSFGFSSRKSEPASFEEMLSRFKQTSDDKFSDLKRKNPEVRRSKRGAKE
ncbi:MAG: S1 RNA-binding domain-containing protein [Clostridia bacterium]|nr:S1 RNA-binding domain-containing protein [Clostridia bacterium]